MFQRFEAKQTSIYETKLRSFVMLRNVYKLINRIKKMRIKYKCELVLQTPKLRMFEYFISER